MIRKNLFNYLPKFDKGDQKQLLKYLQSPFFKIDSRERVIKLYNYLVKFHPEYDDEKLTNEAIAKKLKLSNVKNLKSVLLGCVEDFLVINQLNEKETTKKKLITEALRQKGIFLEHKKHIEFEIEKLRQQAVKNEADYDLLYHLLIEAYVTQSADMVNSKHSLLEEAIHIANSYYLYINIKNLLGRKSLSDLVKRKSDVIVAKEILEQAGKHIEKFDANIVISYYIYSFYDVEEIEEKQLIYNKVNSYSRENYELLTDVYRYDVYVNLLNMANSLFIKGFTHFADVIFDLHKYWISKEVHLSYPNMHYSLFYHIVRSANDVNEFEWSKIFIENNKQCLKETEREETVNLCLADTALKSGEYEKALLVLNKTKFLNSQYSSIGKSFELMSLFKLNDSYRLDTYSKNFDNFIRRHSEITETAKSGHLNFSKYLNKILKAKFDKNDAKLSTLKKAIEDEKDIFYRTWLLAQF